MNLEGKVALVTGAAGGIGRATAERLLDQGASVWLADLANGKVAAAADELGPDATAIRVDLQDRSSIESAVSRVLEVASRIDILVNAAAVYDVDPWLSITEESFDRIFGVNVRGLLFMTQAVGKDMIKGGVKGSIVNVASVGGRRGDPSVVSYAASKAAVISLTQSAARAFATHGIRVNCVAPGPVRTAMYDQVLKLRHDRLGQNADEVDKLLVGAVPLGRISEPAEQANAICFFASEASAYVTGQTLNVDGGMFMN